MAYLQQEMHYSKERNTWNLFVNNEWYFDGTYEQCSDMMINNAVDAGELDVPDEVYPEDDFPDYIDDKVIEDEPDFSEVQDTSILWGSPKDAGAFGGGKY